MLLLGARGTGYWFCDVLGLGVLDRLLDRLMLKHFLPKFFGSFLLVQFDSIFFCLGFWSGTGSLVPITAEGSFYILRINRDTYNAKVEEGAEITDEGVEEAFEVVADVPKR